MTERDIKYLEKETFKDLIGYCQYLDRKKDETRLYNCGGLPVELTLPEGGHVGSARSIGKTYIL